jgi:xylan 1,4-beta-xylosidase
LYEFFKISFIYFYLYKGAYYVPRKCYGHHVDPQSPSLSKILNDIRNNLIVCNEFEKLNNLPIFIDECDPAVGTIYGIYDNPNYIICNTEYYPCFVASMIYHILSLSTRIQLITHWAFYMEGKRLFEGNRTLITNYNLYLPILSGLKLFGKLKYKQLFIEINQTNLPVYGIATGDDDNSSFQLLIFYHVDDWTYQDSQSIDVTFINIPLKYVLVKHYRIDSSHSNAHTEWVKMGKPDELNKNQLEQLKNSQELILLHDPMEYKIENNQLKLNSFNLLAHSISFIEIINNRS